MGEETNSHLWSCPAGRQTRLEAVAEGRRAWLDIVRKCKKGAGPPIIERIADCIFSVHTQAGAEHLPVQDTVGREDPFFLEYLFRGVAPRSWVEKTGELGVGAKIAHRAVGEALEVMIRCGWKDIWLPRCKLQIAWEKEQGITSKNKRAQRWPGRRRARRLRQRKALGIIQRWLPGNVCECGWAPSEHTDRGCSPHGLRARRAVNMYLDLVYRRGSVVAVGAG